MYVDKRDERNIEEDWIEIDNPIADVAGACGEAAQRLAAHRHSLRNAAQAVSGAVSFFVYSVCVKTESFEEQSEVLEELNLVAKPIAVRSLYSSVISS